MGRRIYDWVLDNNDLHHDCEHEKRSVITQTDSDRGRLFTMPEVRQDLANISAVNIRLLARLFHSVQPTNICLVALCSGSTSQHLLVAS